MSWVIIIDGFLNREEGDKVASALRKTMPKLNVRSSWSDDRSVVAEGRQAEKAGLVATKNAHKMAWTVDVLKLWPVTYRIFRENGIRTLGDLTSYSWIKLEGMSGMGHQRLNQIVERLAELELSLSDP